MESKAAPSTQQIGAPTENLRLTDAATYWLEAEEKNNGDESDTFHI